MTRPKHSRRRQIRLAARMTQDRAALLALRVQAQRLRNHKLAPVAEAAKLKAAVLAAQRHHIEKETRESIRAERIWQIESNIRDRVMDVPAADD